MHVISFRVQSAIQAKILKIYGQKILNNKDKNVRIKNLE